MIKLRRVYIGALFFNLLFYVSMFLNYSSIVYGEISLLTTLIVIYECQMQRILKLCNAKKKSECDNKFLNIIEIFPLVIAILTAVYGCLQQYILISLLPLVIIGCSLIFLLKKG